LSFNFFDSQELIQAHKILSVTSNLDEAAHNLYEYLQELDQLDLEVIIAEMMPKKALGNSINDRLKRASHS